MDQRDKTGFPRAILHVDGDSFFVSCELTRRPGLRGRAVVTGEERGIATALNPAAKSLGVVRGMRTSEIRRSFPQVVILPSDYRMYAQYARRMYAIVRRYTDLVEEYSIDECFADVTEAARKGGTAAVEAVAATIQTDLYVELGITFSVGVSVNKVCAKVASKWVKPFGLTVIPREAIPDFLVGLPIGKVWGIGSATTVKLRKLGIATALDLARKDRAWVAEHCDKPLAEIYEEFQGNLVKELETGVGATVPLGGGSRRMPGSLQRTRTFYPAVGVDPRGRDFVWSQLSYHVEDACARLRGQGLVASRVGFFMKTQAFEYIRGEAFLPDASAAPDEVLRAIEPEFERLWKRLEGGAGSSGGARVGRHISFRASGISLGGLKSADDSAQALFDVPARHAGSRLIQSAIDRIARKFGKHSVFLGSSFRAMKHAGDFDEPTGKDRFWDVIYMGEVV